MKRHGYIIFLICISLILFTTGCATLMAGQLSVLSIDSLPQQAIVTITALDTNEKMIKSTPCTIILDKASDYVVRIEYNGYLTEEFVIQRTINGWFWANASNLFTGMILDKMNNNIWEHNKETISTELEKIIETGKLPDKVTIDYPVTFIMNDGQKVVQLVPMTFYKKM